MSENRNSVSQDAHHTRMVNVEPGSVIRPGIEMSVKWLPGTAEQTREQVKVMATRLLAQINDPDQSDWSE